MKAEKGVQVLTRGTKNGMQWLAVDVQFRQESVDSFYAVRLLQLYAQHIIKQNIKSIFHASAARQFYMPR